MKHSAPIALLALSAVVLAGCSATGSAETSADAEVIQVVATTSVYGDIANVVGGDLVEVSSIISSAAQDPHSYEPSSKDKLTVGHADLIVSNGGGYDSFISGLISDEAVPVIEAVTFAGDYPGNDDAAEEEHDHAEDANGDEHDHSDADDEHAGHNHIAGFNEHVWYDPAVIALVADDIAEHLSEIDPENAGTFAANAEKFHTALDGLTGEIDALAATLDHTHILVTEPVALRLTDLLDMHNVTPAAFLEAVEEGQDVAPATLLETLKLLDDDDIALVIANTQTGGNETERIIEEAGVAGIPVLEFAEIIPADTTYVDWMSQNVAALAAALDSRS